MFDCDFAFYLSINITGSLFSDWGFVIYIYIYIYIYLNFLFLKSDINPLGFLSFLRNGFK